MGIAASRKSVDITSKSKKGASADESGTVVAADIKQAEKENAAPVQTEVMNGKSGDSDKDVAKNHEVTPSKATDGNNAEVGDSAAKDTTSLTSPDTQDEKENSEKSEKKKKDKVKKKMSFRSISFLKRKHKEKPAKNGDVPCDDTNKSMETTEGDKSGDVTTESVASKPAESDGGKKSPVKEKAEDVGMPPAAEVQEASVSSESAPPATATAPKEEIAAAPLKEDVAGAKVEDSPLQDSAAESTAIDTPAAQKEMVEELVEETKAHEPEIQPVEPVDDVGSVTVPEPETEAVSENIEDEVDENVAEPKAEPEPEGGKENAPVPEEEAEDDVKPAEDEKPADEPEVGPATPPSDPPPPPPKDDA